MFILYEQKNYFVVFVSKGQMSHDDNIYELLLNMRIHKLLH